MSDSNKILCKLNNYINLILFLMFVIVVVIILCFKWVLLSHQCEENNNVQQKVDTTQINYR